VAGAKVGYGKTAQVGFGELGSFLMQLNQVCQEVLATVLVSWRLACLAESAGNPL
jgi:hypothetical protein